MCSWICVDTLDFFLPLCSYLSISKQRKECKTDFFLKVTDKSIQLTVVRKSSSVSPIEAKEYVILILFNREVNSVWKVLIALGEM